MRQDYLPSTTFCCSCGFVIKDRQIGGHVEGTVTDRASTPGTIKVDPADLYFCNECITQIAENVKNGLQGARRRQRERDRADRTEHRE